jgi:hypothetical protein
VTEGASSRFDPNEVVDELLKSQIALFTSTMLAIPSSSINIMFWESSMLNSMLSSSVEPFYLSHNIRN